MCKPPPVWNKKNTNTSFDMMPIVNAEREKVDSDRVSDAVG